MTPKEQLYGIAASIVLPDIKTLVIEALDTAPEYFWTLPASTSGRHHGGELLIEHVIKCSLMMRDSVFRQMDSVWSQLDRDTALAAMILHDCSRCGYKDPFSMSEDGQLVTNPNHGALEAERLTELVIDMGGPGLDRFPLWLSTMLDAIRYHYGPWCCPTKDREIQFLNLPYTSVVVQVHNVDFHQAGNAQLNKVGTSKDAKVPSD